MTLYDLRALANEFFEWPESSDGRMVSTFSALLFAKHVLEMQQKAQSAAISVSTLELRNALEQEQDPELAAALGWPGGISDPVLDRKTLLQQVARLAQEQAEPVQELVGWRIRAVDSSGWRGQWRAYWQSARPGVNELESCEFEPLYTAPPQRKPLTAEEAGE